MPRVARLRSLGIVALAAAAVACVGPKRQDRSMARVDLGTAYLKEGDAPGAIPVLEEATRLDPRNWNAWNKLGLAYLRQGALDRADHAFSKAVRLAPDEAEVRNNYGFMLLRAGRVDEAVEQFEAALTDLSYRKPALVLNNLGHALLVAERHDEAIQRLSEAIERAPNLCQARFNRGLAYHGRGDVEKALDDFEAVIGLCGDEATGAYYQAARAMVDLDDRGRACTYLQTVIQDAGDSSLGDAAADLHARVCL